MHDAKSGEPRGFTIRFRLKSNPEGLGCIVWASVYHRDRRLWLEAIFLPLDLRETLQQFREASRVVFPDIPPPTFPRTAYKPIGAR
jgi:hypothetical protein